jgi:hypothetical protein
MSKSDNIKLYKNADEYFIINAGHPYDVKYDPDEDLIPIYINLPKPPKPELIENYGLPALEQIWHRPKTPERLALLEKKVKRDLELNASKNDVVNGYKIINAIWKELTNNAQDYKEELDWISRMWYHRLNGYWIYIKGKPTYICGWHFTYLTFWKIDGSFYPRYQDRDRRELLSWKYFYDTKESFADLDEKGRAIPNSFGKYKTIEMAYKTFFGIIEPKGRRQGVSNKAQCVQFEIISRKKSALGVIFSMSEESANKLFKNITVRAFRHMPFFFLPLWDGAYDQSKEIYFNRPKFLILGDDLQSRVTHAESAYGGEFDGQKIDAAVFDEPGKSGSIDTSARWAVHKRAMALGPNIIGFSFHISTTEDMDSDGGMNFQKMVYSSRIHTRSKDTGQTPTGLATVFFPSFDGMEECVDYWGDSIIDDPTPEQIKYGYKLKIGAAKLIQNELDSLLNSGNPKDRIDYQRLRVKMPNKLAQCFELTIGNVSWNLDIINKRLAELRRIEEPTICGDFVWKNGVKFGEVLFYPKPDGKFNINKPLPLQETNQRTRVTVVDHVTGEYKDCWMPTFPNKGTLGVDAFKFKGDKQQVIETGTYQSDGGIAGFLERDYKIDPDEKSIYQWETRTFVLSYRNRPLSDEFNEDVIMAAQYYGFMIYPETNAGTIWEYCLRNNYDGFLLYDIDETNGKYKNRPGVYQLEKSKEDMWTEFQNYIQFRAHKECHANILKEVASLKQFSDLNRLDLAAAAGCALLGSKSRARQLLESVDDTSDDYLWWKSM